MYIFLCGYRIFFNVTFRIHICDSADGLCVLFMFTNNWGSCHDTAFPHIHRQHSPLFRPRNCTEIWNFFFVSLLREREIREYFFRYHPIHESSRIYWPPGWPYIFVSQESAFIFFQGFRLEISRLSRDCVDHHWGWVILQDLTWRNSIRPLFVLVDLESQADEIEEMVKDGCAFVWLDTLQVGQ